MRSTQRFGTALIAAFVLLAQAVAAQTPATGRIAGRVVSDAAAPLANVGVSVVGRQDGARTGADGRYLITNLPPGRYVVRSALIGYSPSADTVDVTAGGTATADFTLKEVSVTLDQMVVIGYGSQRRSDQTGAVTPVTPSVDRTPTTSLEQTLQGTAPGVQVTQASSAPGGGMSIRIRGGSSVNGNIEPLYVIDGFPVENDFSTSSSLDGGRDNTTPANPLAALNPNDIASIEILKDASATAIYAKPSEPPHLWPSSRSDAGQGSRIVRMHLDRREGRRCECARTRGRVRRGTMRERRERRVDDLLFGVHQMTVWSAAPFVSKRYVRFASS